MLLTTLSFQQGAICKKKFENSLTPIDRLDSTLLPAIILAVMRTMEGRPSSVMAFLSLSRSI